MKSLVLRQKDIEQLQNVFRRFEFVQEAHVFGSRANGTASRSSDLDLAVSSPDATPSEWSQFCEALENAPVIYELEVVRRETLANKQLAEKIEQEGIRIYSR